MRILPIVLSTLLLFGCAAPQERPECDLPPVALEPVAVDLSVISLAQGAGSIVQALGAGDALLGSDLASNTGKEILNPGHQIALERVLQLNPDLAFVDEQEPDERALEGLLASGAKLVPLSTPSSLTEAFAQVELIAAALGIPDQAVALKDAINSQLAGLDSAKLAGQRIAFLYLRGNAGVFLLGGQDSGADELIRLLGGQDVGSELGIQGFAPISAESLQAANPDYLLVMEKGLASVGGVSELVRLPGVLGTNAAKTGRILVGRDDELLSFGPSTPKVLACLVEQVK